MIALLAVVSIALPVSVAPSGRYLLDANGLPTPIFSRTAHGWAGRMGTSDITEFLDDTQRRGYNAIETTFIWHNPGHHNAGHDGLGNLPFVNNLGATAWVFDGTNQTGTTAPDFTTPNASYWASVDDFVTKANDRGILLILYNLYLGFTCSDNQGWWSEMAANDSHTGTGSFGTTSWSDPSKSFVWNFSAWMGDRYKNFPNIAWLAAGDCTPASANLTAMNSSINGLISVASPYTRYWGAEWASPNNAADVSTVVTITLNGVYPSDATTIGARSRVAYGHNPVIPAYERECCYDQSGPDGSGTNTSATQPVRRFTWWSWLNVIGGVNPGSQAINRNFTAGEAWDGKAWDDGAHAGDQYHRDMQYMKQLIDSIEWWKLVPSGLGNMGTIITAGNGAVDSSTYVAAAADPDGSLIVAYLGPSHGANITVDMTKMSRTARARWWDPTGGMFHSTIGTFAPTGTQVFTPPATNTAGSTDWVLVIGEQVHTGTRRHRAR